MRTKSNRNELAELTGASSGPDKAFELSNSLFIGIELFFSRPFVRPSVAPPQR
jgi:hypothetical protein